MNKIRFLGVGWAMALVLLVAAPATTTAAGKTLRVTFKKATVRAKPHPLGKIVGSLPYRTKVHLLGPKKGAWLNVRPELNGVGVGWIHTRSVTSKPLQLKAGAASARAKVTREEQDIAGRSWDKEIETQYRKGNASLDAAFKQLDQIEQSPVQQVSTDQIEAFMKAGGLTAETGA